MSATEKLDLILKALCEARDDAIKSTSGNASAGRRLRKTCMEVTHSLKELRAMVITSQKNKV
jgi:hypothetical protein